ncbi:MAG TPA: glycosyltransferase family 4 protein [Solirubrobacteraceae bacterium]|nr:glycosyltransferase family 4 protein [Solirubrobacteraceae bacterium]
MRVLMLAQFYAPVVGGEERMTETLAVSLARAGHDVAVATLRADGQPAFEERDGVRVHRIGGTAQRLPFLFSDEGRRHHPPVPDPETVFALRRVLALERPDVVHGHNWLALSYLPLRRARPRRAYVLSLHDYSLICANKRLMRFGAPCSGPGPVKCLRCAADWYGAASGPPVALATMLSGALQRRAVDLFLPVSREVARRCGLESGRAPYEIVPNFLIDEPPHSAEAEPAGLPDGEFVLYVGDVAADKGVQTLLDAHARLPAGAQLVLIGRVVEPQLIAQGRPGVTALGVLGHDAVMGAWRRAAVAVVPSITGETFGLVALEAMASGVAVVASRVGGLPEVLGADGGILVEPGNPAALAGALERLLAQPGERARQGAAGARRAAEQFTAAVVVPRVEAAYERASTSAS